MDKSTTIAVTLATCLLLLGIGLGFSNFKLDLQIMHILIGVSFILIVVSGIQNHYSRLINISPTNSLAWMHFIVFSLLLFLSIRALRHWYFDKHHNDKKHKH